MICSRSAIAGVTAVLIATSAGAADAVEVEPAIGVESAGEVAGLPAVVLGPGARAPAKAFDSAVEYTTLPTLQRLVRLFDFEEAAIAPFEMPLHFYRYGGNASGDGAASQGFPPFGTMRLSNSHSMSGDWSFEFSLDGGSLAARVPTAVLPVVPLADYMVTVKVRTEGLVHARARLVGWLHDSSGRIIDESRAQSELVDTQGRWKTLSVVVRGRHADAADLGVELQLLQPKQFQSSRLGHASETIPVEDVRGRAWFDDVAVWHMPRVELSTGRLGNVFTNDDSLHLKMLVRDLSDEDMLGDLEVFDLDGQMLFHKDFGPSQIVQTQQIKLPIAKRGWYRAVLSVRSADEGHRLIARRTLDFAVLAAEGRNRSRNHMNPFGIAIPADWLRDAPTTLHMLQLLSVGCAIVPIWSNVASTSEMATDSAHLRAAMETLLGRGVEITFSLEEVPSDLAAAIDVSSDDVLRALASDQRIWRGHLHDLLLNFGMEVRRWQVGSLRAAIRGRSHTDGVEPTIKLAVDGLATFVPGPIVYVPVLAEAFHEGCGDDCGFNVIIPNEVQPEHIDDYVSAWRGAFRDSGRSNNELALMLTIEPTQHGIYATRREAVDLMLRGLHAWRSGVERIMLPAPWRTLGHDAGGAIGCGRIMPDPAFVIWRQASVHLTGRRFGGELPLGDGMRCWILRSAAGEGNAVIVAWSERAGTMSPSALRLQLAPGSVTVHDSFGNKRAIHANSRGEHVVELGDLPVFIEGVHPELVQFRGGFSFEPHDIASEHRVQEHYIVLMNPWSIPITGTLHLREIEQVRIAPRSHDFIIRPHSVARLPVEVVVERSAVAGPRQLEADVTVVADNTYQYVLTAGVNIGLEQIDASATWALAYNVQSGREDLIVTYYVSNKGDRTLNLEVFLIAPQEAHVPHLRRLVSGLEPGEVAVRSFHVPDGATILAGQSVRLGVTERGGSARLNQVLEIPDFSTPMAKADPN